MSNVSEQRQASEPAKREESQEREQPLLRPPADIFEHDNGITMLLDLPGVSRDRLDIQADRHSLVVEGDLSIDVPEGTESLHADIRATRYRRSFSLSGEQLDTDAVEASLKDGVLRIDIPKRAELKPRRIEVQTG
jgi:HSP20 family molecular chaperone IbpA